MNAVFSAPRNPGGRIPIHARWYIVDSKLIFGRTIGELNVHRLTGCTILSVRRDEAVVSYPDRNFILVKNDQLQVAGTNEQLSYFERAFALSENATNARDLQNAFTTLKRVA